MSMNDNDTKTFRGSRRVAILMATILLLLLVSIVTASIGAMPMGAMDLLITTQSLINDSQNYCNDDSTGPQTCREWCLTTETGHVIPQGRFVCVDENM